MFPTKSFLRKAKIIFHVLAENARKNLLVTKMIVVKSKVRDLIKEIGDFKVGGDLFDALDNLVTEIVKKAAERAKANGRKTVSARDL